MGPKKEKKVNYNDHFGGRLTKKAGADDQLLEYLTNHGSSSEWIKAMKLWIRTQNRKEVDNIREIIELEATEAKSKGNYHQKRGPYRKKTDSDIHDEILALRAENKRLKERKHSNEAEPSEDNSSLDKLTETTKTTETTVKNNTEKTESVVSPSKAYTALQSLIKR